MYNVIIIGSGCAGLTAAIYAGRANLKPLVIDGYEPGSTPGEGSYAGQYDKFYNNIVKGAWAAEAAAAKNKADAAAK